VQYGPTAYKRARLIYLPAGGEGGAGPYNSIQTVQTILHNSLTIDDTVRVPRGQMRGTAKFYHCQNRMQVTLLYG
jgi:hypothetical protein